jgi:hypothetical protein
MLFSSIQKNGNVLYVCLCSLSSATNIVQPGDWKLLNYKLMNELFVKNNTVPDVYGTKPINGIPNPVDLTNFIPQEGSRNFYDYTHPSNTNVNVRVFQTPLAVSNDVINMLKSKLTQEIYILILKQLLIVQLIQQIIYFFILVKIYRIIIRFMKIMQNKKIHLKILMIQMMQQVMQKMQKTINQKMQQVMQLMQQVIQQVMQKTIRILLIN